MPTNQLHIPNLVIARKINSFDRRFLGDHFLDFFHDPIHLVENPTPNIDLSPEQKAALDSALFWIVNPDPARRLFVLGGFAGCGKTVLIRHLHAFLEEVKIAHAVVSFTNRVAAVLRNQGIKDAKTIHSLLYHLDQDALRKGETRFLRNGFLHENLIIIDDGSIITQEMLDDFLQFPAVRVLVVGDHGQLGPVDNQPGVMGSPDFTLETVHRQALDSGILKVAHAFRTGKRPGYGAAADVTVQSRKLVDNLYQEFRPDQDQILCGFNRTRHKINSKVRNQLNYGLNSNYLFPGEKIICISNNYSLGIYNGQIFTVEHCQDFADEIISIDMNDGQDRFLGIKAFGPQFGIDRINDKAALRRLAQKHRLPTGISLFDYSYCMSVHKAMGSQWPRVIVVEETHPEWDLPRWAYTAVTRASDYLRYYY